MAVSNKRLILLHCFSFDDFFLVGFSWSHTRNKKICLQCKLDMVYMKVNTVTIYTKSSNYQFFLFSLLDVYMQFERNTAVFLWIFHSSLTKKNNILESNNPKTHQNGFSKWIELRESKQSIKLSISILFSSCSRFPHDFSFFFCVLDSQNQPTL